jgi:hypothetical protein
VEKEEKAYYYVCRAQGGRGIDYERGPRLGPATCKAAVRYRRHGYWKSVS